MTSETRRWLRPLTNRKVGTKIMTAVLIVALFSLVDGLFALSSLAATNQQVKNVYGHSGELNTIGDLRSAVNQTWLVVDDYLLASDDAGRTTAEAALSTSRGAVTTSAMAYRDYPITASARAAADAFDTSWTRYTALVQDRLLPLARQGDRTTLTAVRAGEQARVMVDIRSSLSTLAQS